MKKLVVFGIIFTIIFIGFFACDNFSNQEEFTVTFDAIGGYIPNNSESFFKIKVKYGETISNLPDPQMLDGYFSGWYTQKNGSGDLFDSSTVVTSNLTVFAKWTSYEFEKGFIFDEETFMLNWNAWNDRNIKNYSFVLRYTFPYINTKITYKNGIIYSYENIDPYGCSENFEYLISLSPLEVPDFTSMTHLYQSINDIVLREKQYKLSNHIISRTVQLEYGALNNITFYYISTEYIQGYKPCLDGDFPYVISDFQIID